MKTNLIYILLFVLLILTSCGGPYSSTSSFLKVIEKGHSDNYKEYWVKAYDPNNDIEADAFKIVVNEEMAWYLIEVGKEYFTTYSKKGNHPWILEQIEQIEIEPQN